MGIGNRLRKPLLAALLLFAGIALTATPRDGASAALLDQVLYSFCSQANCADGSLPAAAPIMDAAGNLYGTTAGNVFKLVPNKDGSGWTETVLYRFCSQTNCADGSGPSGLIMDTAGNLYGTTTYGGSANRGAVFKLTPDQSGGWAETVIYSFCSQGPCLTGEQPAGGVTMDLLGNLYGTAKWGGNGDGTVYQLTPDQSGTNWTATTLHSFCPNFNCADGANPSGELAVDGGGNVYGTTQYGGANNKGTAFQLTPGKGWNHNILYSFCSQANCADGGQPQAGMIIDKSGNLYGTTDNVVFQLSPQTSGWSYQLLHTSCSLSNCADGGDLVDNVILDRAGNLYGTTNVGGNRRCGNSTLYGCGVVFELTPPNQYFGWTETVLYSFCPQGSCTDGSGPQAGLTMDAAGNLYGTTYFGGNYTYCGYG